MNKSYLDLVDVVLISGLVAYTLAVTAILNSWLPFFFRKICIL
jgi:hypothetical protein